MTACCAIHDRVTVSEITGLRERLSGMVLSNRDRQLRPSKGTEVLPTGPSSHPTDIEFDRLHRPIALDSKE